MLTRLVLEGRLLQLGRASLGQGEVGVEYHGDTVPMREQVEFFHGTHVGAGDMTIGDPVGRHGHDFLHHIDLRQHVCHGEGSHDSPFIPRNDGDRPA